MKKHFEMQAHNHYEAVCRDKHGNIKWEDSVENLIPTLGLNDVLNVYLGSTAKSSKFLGLVANTGFTAFAATDTAAKITDTANPPTTNGWQEEDAYTEGSRQELVFAAASGGSTDNSASKVVITASDTITLKGAFISTSSVLLGTTGVLYGEGAWSSGLVRSMEAGDTLTITVTCTQASA